MKARTMVYLDPEQLEAVRAEAKSRRISIAELIRRLVQEHLERRRMPSSVSPEAYLKIVALGSSGLEDVSEHHDSYLGRALHRERAR